MARKISKTEIKKIKEKLLKDRIEIVKRVEELKRNDPFQDPDHASDNAAVDTDVREQVSHDTIEAQIKSLNTKLKNIDLAVEKMHKNKYGLCEKCNSQIINKRLRLIPEARFCISCEQKLFQ
jgi:DnaK suppressor protein